MPSESSLPPPPRHLRVFLWVGALALIAVLLLPLLLTQYVRAERARFAACDRHERIDCDPSIIWLLMK
jgi:hypothetical protein